MYPPIPAPETAVLFGLVGASSAVALRLLLPAWWRTDPVRWALLLTLGAGLVGFALWCGAPAWGAWGLASQGVGLAWMALFALATLTVTLPVAAAVRALGHALTRVASARATPIVACVERVAPPAAVAVPPGRTDKLAGPRGSAVAPSSPPLPRRVLLEGVAASVPLLALRESVLGFARADAPQAMPVVRMRFADLPAELSGLRILHLSDLHLGVSFHVADLERLLERARAHAPHLVVVTGDLADDEREILPALRAIDQFRAPLGAFASLGNHEYLHDIRRTRPLFDKSPVPLLVDQGTSLRVGRSRLYVSGADDPVYLTGTQRFLRASVERGLDGAPSDAFRLLLSHRPEGFVPASANGVHLTLSGHTHGGQIALAGESVFQRLGRPAWLKYAWGSYARGATRLYTTSGFGHWFPFRVACPTEVPVVVLERGGGVGAAGEAKAPGD